MPRPKSDKKKERINKKELAEVSIDELKDRIVKAEERYHNSFKKDSCQEIMNSYYDWQRAKKAYYTAIGICRPQKESDPMNELAMSVNEDEDSTDFNSLI